MVTVGKLTQGHIGFLYPSTRQWEGDAGVIAEIQMGGQDDEVHAKFELLDGTTRIYDYNRVGDAGQSTAHETRAIVKQLTPPIEAALSHQEWSVEEVTDGSWALARDPWAGRLHWLPPRTEGGDSVYSVHVGDRWYEVAMQTLL